MTALVGLGVVASARGQVDRARIATLRYDLAAGQLEVAADGRLQRFDLGAGALAPRLSRFRADLARGQWDEREAAGLGEILLGPAAELLRNHPDWEVIPAEAAPLSALLAPWGTDGQLVLQSTTVWYRPAGWGPADLDSPQLRRSRGERAPWKGSGVLVVAPFTPERQPAVDNPDTLLAVLRPEIRPVDFVPRNDVAPAPVAGALGEHQYAAVWLRALPDSALVLLPALSGGPPLLWWSRPMAGGSKLDEPGAADAASDPTFHIVQRWAEGGKVLLLDLWPRPESQVAAGATPFLEALRNGLPVAEAVARARRSLRTDASISVGDWAGWVVVGDGGHRLEISRPSWLYRFFRRRG